MSRIVFLHGLESTVDDELRPIGRKAQFLRRHYDAAMPGLDTRDAVALRDRCVAQRVGWLADPAAAAAAIATPMRNARAAITDETEIIVASSFGGAVLMALLHEASAWRGGCVFLAGAGLKLTPYTTLPDRCPTILIHGRHDDVVDPADSQKLARTGAGLSQYWEVDDGHRLPTVMADGTLHAAIGLVEAALRAQ